MLKIYHNPRCSKSRAGLKYLQENNIGHEVEKYLDNPPTPEKIKELLDKMGKKPMDIVRTQEQVYKSEFKGKDIPDEDWYKILSEHPRLLKRPIIEKNDKAVLAQPPEEIEKLR
ncbi:MAG: arsenate reductase (glutaredoxin) [Bacteroidales bacterium]|nr:arsenate reductase (glutaredoxin) [Bacteroidales bacterium]